VATWVEAGDVALSTRIVHSQVAEGEPIEVLLQWSLSSRADDQSRLLDASATFGQTELELVGETNRWKWTLGRCDHKFGPTKTLGIEIRPRGSIKADHRSVESSAEVGNRPLVPGKYRLRVTSRLVSSKDGNVVALPPIELALDVHAGANSTSLKERLEALAGAELRRRVPQGRHITSLGSYESQVRTLVVQFSYEHNLIGLIMSPEGALLGATRQTLCSELRDLDTPPWWKNAYPCVEDVFPPTHVLAKLECGPFG
jgi:hypothetical protein